MKILYVSVHQILEFDEIRMFHDLGYFVFPLGVYFGGKTSEPFRPNIEFPPSLSEHLDIFERLGGKYGYARPATDQIIPREFIELFDVVIVMHDFDFLEHHWPALSAAKVVWRSIGVGVQEYEHRVKPLRDKGCRVVRYSPTEQLAVGYAGHDAIIRFGKHDPASQWAGGEQQILTFSHYLPQRFPREYEFYAAATANLTTVLCGDGNTGLAGAAGIVDFETQMRLLTHSSIYFYAGGTFIPYTLNFMEAWMIGIPLVATDCRAVYPPEQCVFADVPNLIKSGQNGFLVSTPDQASGLFRDLMADPAMAKEIGDRGAADARAHFSAAVIGPQWRAFLERLVASPSRCDPNLVEVTPPARLKSLLRRFRIGKTAGRT